VVVDEDEPARTDLRNARGVERRLSVRLAERRRLDLPSAQTTRDCVKRSRDFGSPVRHVVPPQRQLAGKCWRQHNIRNSRLCLRSCGVIACTLARFTAPANHPPSDFGRGRYPPSDPGNTRSPGALPLHCADNSSRTNPGTGTDRALRPLVGPTAWSTPSWTAFSCTD